MTVKRYNLLTVLITYYTLYTRQSLPQRWKTKCVGSVSSGQGIVRNVLSADHYLCVLPDVQIHHVFRHHGHLSRLFHIRSAYSVSVCVLVCVR